jgi:hypothetical protein
MQAELALEWRCTLGEGPVRDESEQPLYFLDIMAPAPSGTGGLPCLRDGDSRRRSSRRTRFPAASS